MLPMLCTAAANIVGQGVAVRRDNQTERTFEKKYFSNPAMAAAIQPEVQKYGSFDKYLDNFYPVEWGPVLKNVCTSGSLVNRLLFPAIAVLAWPWLTLFGLSIFQFSMRRARVRRIHVLRCIFYSADVAFWLGLVIVPVALVFAFRQPIRSPWAYLSVGSWELRGCIVALFVFGYRLIIAYRSYLRFPRSVWAILASQVIASLLLLILWVLLGIVAY